MSDCRHSRYSARPSCSWGSEQMIQYIIHCLLPILYQALIVIDFHVADGDVRVQDAKELFLINWAHSYCFLVGFDSSREIILFEYIIGFLLQFVSLFQTLWNLLHNLLNQVLNTLSRLLDTFLYYLNLWLFQVLLVIRHLNQLIIIMGNTSIFDSQIPHPPFAGGVPQKPIQIIQILKTYNIRYFAEAFKQDQLQCDTVLVPEAGHTFLHEVIVRGGKDLFRLCELYGADWNKRDILGVTPLMKAASAGNMYFVEQILKNGADIN